MTLPSEAAFLACQDIDSIVFLMYANRLHVRHFDNRGLFVCLTSLCLQSFEDEISEPDFEEEHEMLELETSKESRDFVFKE